MPESASAAPRAHLFTTGRSLGRLAVLDAIATDVETGLVHLELSVDDPKDTEPCREALRTRLCRLRDAASALRAALVTPAVRPGDARGPSDPAIERASDVLLHK